MTVQVWVRDRARVKCRVKCRDLCRDGVDNHKDILGTKVAVRPILPFLDRFCAIGRVRLYERVRVRITYG